MATRNHFSVLLVDGESIIFMNTYDLLIYPVASTFSHRLSKLRLWTLRFLTGDVSRINAHPDQQFGPFFGRHRRDDFLHELCTKSLLTTL
jgi:hypothetical protein